MEHRALLDFIKYSINRWASTHNAEVILDQRTANIICVLIKKLNEDMPLNKQLIEESVNWFLITKLGNHIIVRYKY